MRARPDSIRHAVALYRVSTVEQGTRPPQPGQNVMVFRYGVHALPAPKFAANWPPATENGMARCGS